MGDFDMDCFKLEDISEYLDIGNNKLFVWVDIYFWLKYYIDNC